MGDPESRSIGRWRDSLADTLTECQGLEPQVTLQEGQALPAQDPSQMSEKYPILNEILNKRLQSVSMVQSSLVTSLHDVMMDNLNKGFVSATSKFKEILDRVEMSEPIEYVTLAIAGVLLILNLIQSAFIMIQNKGSKKKQEEDAIEMKTGFSQREREEKQKECDEKLRDLVEQLKVREDRMEKKLDRLESYLKALESSMIMIMTQTVQTAVAVEVSKYQAVAPGARAVQV